MFAAPVAEGFEVVAKFTEIETCQGIGRARSSPATRRREQRSEFQDPSPHCFVGDTQSTFASRSSTLR